MYSSPDAYPKPLKEALLKVVVFFNGDRVKCYNWLNLPNPAFGDASPRDLIDKGGEQVVIDFINIQLMGIYNK